MKAISIKQPYADLILNGLKTLEIRTWKTKYRGRLYIHSCKEPAIIGKKCGYILGYVDLTNIRDTKNGDNAKAHIKFCSKTGGFYAWVVSKPTKIKPIPFKGRLGIFDIEEI